MFPIWQSVKRIDHVWVQTTSQEDLERRRKQAEAIEELRRKQLERQEQRKAEYAAKVREWRLQQLERRRTQMEQPQQPQTETNQQLQRKTDISQPVTEPYQQQRDADISRPKSDQQHKQESDISRQSAAPQDDFRLRQLRRLTTLEPSKPSTLEQGEKTSTVGQPKKLFWSAEGRSNASNAYDRSKLFYDNIGRRRETRIPERSDQDQGRTSVSGEGQKPSLNESRTNIPEGGESRTGRGRSIPETGMSQRQPSRVNEDGRDRSAADGEKLHKLKWQSVDNSGGGGSFSNNRMKMDQRQRADARAQ